MTLPIRASKRHDRSITAAACPRELRCIEEQLTDGLPWLSGELESPAPQPLTLIVRIHNHSGIPIIEGQSQIEAGQRQFTITNLRPLGIEAYAHKREAERMEIAHRIWSRRAYATLTFQVIA